MDARVKARQYPGEDEHIDWKETFITLKNLALLPYRLLVSKPAQRAYITTIILAVVGFFLAIVASISYFFFYYSYIPDLSFTIPIYLEHSTSSISGRYTDGSGGIEQYSPWGRTDIASVGASLQSNQAYDVVVELSLPRTTSNIETGNFMVDVALTSRDFTVGKAGLAGGVGGEGADEEGVITRSRRPTILTQRSSAIEWASKLLALPWYLAGWKTETESLEIKMLDRVRFTRGWRNIPKTVVLRLESMQRLQIYTAQVKIEARLAGLRWMMYRHRIFSFIALTTIFWFLEMASALILYILCSYYFFNRPSMSSRAHLTSRNRYEMEGPGVQEFAKERELGDVDVGVVKTEGIDAEEDADFTDDFDLSDTSRTFPSFSRHPPLRYSSLVPKGLKVEEDMEEEDDEDDEAADSLGTLGEAGTGKSSRINLSRDAGLGSGAAADADDEDDEDADYVFQGPPGSGLGTTATDSAFGTGGVHVSDSGIGTSMESSAGQTDSIRRRKSSSKRDR